MARHRQDSPEYRLNPLAIDGASAVQIQAAPDHFVEVERPLIERLRACFGSQRNSRTRTAIVGALREVLGVADPDQLVERLVRNRIVLPADIDLAAFVEATLRPLHIATGVVAERASFARTKAEARATKPHVPEAVRRRSFLYANGLKPERAGFFSGWLIAAARLDCVISMSVESGRLELVVESPDGARRRFGKFRWIEEADPRAEMVTENKRDSNYMMHLAGLPVAEQATVDFGDLGALRSFGDAVGYPLVLKPALGHDGVDVYPGLETAEEVGRLALAVRERWQDRGGVIVEKHIAGSNFRLVVVGSELLGAYGASAVVLEGDASSTIRELIERENRKKLAGGAPERGEKLIEPGDPEIARNLRSQSLTLESVLPSDQRFQPNRNLNRGKGARIERVPLERIHPEVRRAAIRAVQVFGLHVGAVDYIAESIEAPPRRGGRICEVQAHPALPYDLLDLERGVLLMFERALASEPGVPSAVLEVREDVPDSFRPFPHPLTSAPRPGRGR